MAGLPRFFRTPKFGQKVRHTGFAHKLNHHAHLLARGAGPKIAKEVRRVSWWEFCLEPDTVAEALVSVKSQSLL